jgi:8-oxo-dGTP diphosphatase
MVGNSVGGSCALEVALQAPDRVEVIVLIGANAGGRPEPFRDEAVRVFREKGMDEAWPRYWGGCLGVKPDPKGFGPEHGGVRPASMGDSQTNGGHHTVAGLLVQPGAALLCLRSAGRRRCPNVWDLPGGHIENSVTPPRALARDLHEELGIVIPEPTEPPVADLHRSDFDCPILVVTEWLGTPRIISDEHDEAGWSSPRSIGELALADESYRPLIERALGKVGT